MGGLHPHVNVAGAAGVEARDDGFQAVLAVGVGELVAAQGVALVVVASLVIGLPEVQQHAGEGLAIGLQHVSDQHQGGSRQAGFEQAGALRGVRGVERAGALAGRRFVPIAAFRRRRHGVGLGLGSGFVVVHGAGQRAAEGQSQHTGAARLQQAAARPRIVLPVASLTSAVRIHRAAPLDLNSGA